MDEDTDSDASNIIPLRGELQKCSDILAEESTFTNEFFQSASNIIHVDHLNISLPSSSKTDVNLQSSGKADKISKEDISLISKEQEDELLGLGVSVYDQTEFENEVIGKVDKALKAQEEQKRKTDLQRELKTVAEDIRYAKQRLSHIDKALSMAPKDSMSISNAAKRELAAIKKEQENKLKHLKKLEAKQKTLQAFVSGNAEEAENAVQDNFEGEEEMDEETLYHLKSVFSSKETEEERLIRLGQMTPFGTVMQNRSPPKPKPRTIIVPEDQLTDFDKFLLNEAEAHKNKKSLKPVHKHPKPSTSKCSETNSMIEKPSNLPAFTDLKAVVRKKQKVKVKLGSKHANGYLKKVNLNKGLVKNYKSDSEVSDLEMEDYNDEESFNTSDDEYRPDHDIDEDDDYEIQERKPKKMRTGSRKKSNLSSEESESCLKSVRSKAKKIV
ncbi:DNA excision repair protein ERCC-6, partial [Stegodyphus mimosarum]